MTVLECKIRFLKNWYNVDTEKELMECLVNATYKQCIEFQDMHKKDKEK